MTLTAIGHQGHDTSKEKGFLEGAPRTLSTEHDVRMVLSYLALIHSEVSEAVEEARCGQAYSMGMELADVILRVTQLCYTMGIPLEDMVYEKLEYNKTRPYKHGDKLA